MIAFSTEDGVLIKSLVPGETYGFHRLFGLIQTSSLEKRIEDRDHHGLADPKASGSPWLFLFRLAGTDRDLKVEGLESCEVQPVKQNEWKLKTAVGTYALGLLSQINPVLLFKSPAYANVSRKAWIGVSTFALLFLIGMPFLSPIHIEAPVEVAETVVVKVPDVQKAVTVPVAQNATIAKLVSKTQDVQTKRAVAQNLGFLGMIGRKDLKKVLGGAPTIQDASAVAGAGGKEGSGGELLVGLGQGVKRSTVGNSGVAGLGGIGTHGRGGGAGGYGNSLVGSGNGKSISAMALSEDAVMEGGLDKSVIQATIAKYLRDVRACYEAGLQKIPGLTGTVTMAFEIGSSGSLNSGHVSRSTLGNSEVERCIGTKIMSWKFPRPLGGVNVKVNYPFLLRPISS